MNIRKKITISVFIFCIFIFILNINSYAATQSWKSLDYNVKLNKDGSADIIETWDVSISQTNTLFKSFVLKSDDSYSFTNPKVVEVRNGKEYKLKQIFEEQYHVDSGCYYGLKLSANKYEIAWNVGLDSSSARRIYKIYYTVNNAVKIYNDCTEFYWQFLSSSNTMYGQNITGTITIPEGITDIENLRIWGHGNLSGELEKIDNKTIRFTMPSIRINQMLEIRIVTNDNIYKSCTNKLNFNNFENIMKEESKWSKKANFNRGIIYFMKYIFPLMIISIIAFNIFRIIKKRNRT